MKINHRIFIPILALCLAGCSNSNSSSQSGIEGELPSEVSSISQSNLPEAEIMIEDASYVGTIRDIYDNFSFYEGKVIQINGIVFNTGEGSFIGKHTTYPYQDGDDMIYLEFKSDKDIEDGQWATITGTLQQEQADEGIYYYIEANDIQFTSEGTDDLDNIDASSTYIWRNKHSE